jgi:hypothetical protein
MVKAVFFVWAVSREEKRSANMNVMDVFIVELRFILDWFGEN